MEKMLIVTDSEARVAALRAQTDGAEVFVLVGLPVRVSLKPCAGGACDRGNFSFGFTPLEAGKPLLAKLREYVGADIYLAFDVDQRGEFLSWLVAKALDFIDPAASSSLRRLHPLALHQEELRESFRRVATIREQWAVGYHSRAAFEMALARHLQRLLGTQAGPGGVPLSSSCLTMIFLLAEREVEIKAHAPRPKQKLTVKFAGPGGIFPARLVYAYGVTEDGDLYGAKEVSAAQRLFDGQDFVVHAVERTGLEVAPPAPYRLVELLEDAYVLHHIPIAQALAAVQRLFDGVEVEGRFAGLVSTPSAIDIPTSVLLAKIRQQVERLVGADMMQAEGAVASGEGYLLPTRPDLDGKALGGALGEEEQVVYELIRSRALASQMLPARGETVEVDIQAGEHCYFRASSSTVNDLGFLNVFQGKQERELAKPCPLASFREGDILVVEQIVPESSVAAVTQFYTIETLFADLSDFAIEPGHAALSLLHLLVDRGYVAFLHTGELTCRENVQKVVTTFARLFPTMAGLNFSAYLEQTVAEVLSGRKPLDVALRQFDQTMLMKGNVLRKIAVPVTMQPRLRQRKSRSVIKAGAPPPAAAPAPAKAPPVATAGESPAATAPVQVEPVEDAAPVAVEPDAVPAGEAGERADEGARSAREMDEGGGVPEVDGAVAEVDQAPVSVEPEPEVVPDSESDFDSESALESEPEEATAEVSSVDLALDGVEALEEKTPVPVSEEDTRQAEEIFAEQAESPAPQMPPSAAPPAVAAAEEEGMACPVCGKARILSKRTPTGKPFYVCPAADCEFMAWASPYPLPCQVCGSPFLVERKTVQGGVFLRCPRAGCNFRCPLPGADGAELLAGEQQPRKKVLVRRVARKAGGSATGKTRKVLVRRRK